MRYLINNNNTEIVFYENELQKAKEYYLPNSNILIKENYIGNDPFPVNYTSYIYANDFNRKVNVNSNTDLSDLNNFTEELNRVKIFGPATWLTAYVNQKITDVN